MARRRTKYAGIVQVGTNRYRVVCRIRYNGRIEHRQETITGTLEQARAKYETLKAEIRGQVPACSLKYTDMTFQNLISLYVEKRGEISPKYRYLINTLMQDLGNVRLNSFADRFQDYILLLRNKNTVRGGKYSNATINKCVSTVRAIFNVAVAMEYIKENPINKYRFPKYKTAPRDVMLSMDDRQRLLDVAGRNKQSEYLVPFLTYILEVPCRKSEVVNMVVADIDIFNNCVRVRNGTTKNDCGVWKPIPPNMVEYFQNRVRDGKPDEPVFYRPCPWNNSKRPLGDFKHIWDKVRKGAGLPDLRIHDTRHVSATNLIDNGTPEQVVMSVAGWKSNMLKIYYHRESKKAMNLISWNKKCDSAVIV